MKRIAPRVFPNAALAAAGVIVAIGAAEIGVRAFDPQPAYLYRFSPTTRYEPIPGARFTYRREEFAVPITYNSFGMRDRERTIESASGALRIALLGDSFAEAKEVPFDSTLAQALERCLAASGDGRRVEVLNFGVSGFGTVASAIRFETLAQRFRPDVTIYLFVHNDPEDNVANDARLYTLDDSQLRFRTTHLHGAKRFAREFVDWSKRHLHSYRFLRFRLDRLKSARQEERSAGAAGAGGSESRDDDPSAPGWRVARLALERLRDRVAENGGALVVVQATTTGDAMTRTLAATCEGLGIPLIDVVPALAADAGPVSYRFDGHWRSRGHDVAARAIAAALAPVIGSRASQGADAHAGHAPDAER